MNKMLIIFVVGMLSIGCSNNKANLDMPVLSGMVMEVKPSDTSHFDSNPDLLKIYWFGTTSHFIQFGEIALLTDPFVTTGLGKLIKAESDKLEVNKTFGRLKQPPDAIFISHSHIDHLLDAHTAMLLPTWKQVPLYGSVSTRNILMGHGIPDINKRVKRVEFKPYGKWMPLPISKQKSDKGYSIEYMALESDHTPHIPYTPLLENNFSFSGTFLDGLIKKPLSKPPNIIDYQSGEVYNFLFRFRHGKTAFIVLMLGSPMPLKNYPHSLPPEEIPIDVVFGLVANADNVDDYPQKHIERLKPRVIVLSHFNNFFNKNADEILHIGGRPKVDINKYLLDIQEISGYSRFEKLIVPAITEFKCDLIKNVILIEPKN